MAQEEEAGRGKELDGETHKLSHTTTVQTSSLPPKLNFKRLESIQRLLQYGAALTLVVFLVLIVFSYFEWRGTIDEIKTNEQKIEEQKKILADKLAELKQSNENLAKQQEELDRQREDLKKNEEIIKKQNEEVSEKQKLIDGFKEVLKNKSVQNGGDKQTPPLIYVHIAREDQRARAAEIVRQLKSKGYLVPGIENVNKKAPEASQLRACSSNDVAKNDVIEITKALASLSAASVEPKYLTNCGISRPRHYEIWFGANFQ